MAKKNAKTVKPAAKNTAPTKTTARTSAVARTMPTRPTLAKKTSKKGRIVA